MQCTLTTRDGVRERVLTLDDAPAAAPGVALFVPAASGGRGGDGASSSSALVQTSTHDDRTYFCLLDALPPPVAQSRSAGKAAARRVVVVWDASLSAEAAVTGKGRNLSTLTTAIEALDGRVSEVEIFLLRNDLTRCGAALAADDYPTGRALAEAVTARLCNEARRHQGGVEVLL